jgi:hypothetical protein
MENYNPWGYDVEVEPSEDPDQEENPDETLPPQPGDDQA